MLLFAYESSPEFPRHFIPRVSEAMKAPEKTISIKMKCLSRNRPRADPLATSRGTTMMRWQGQVRKAATSIS